MARKHRSTLVDVTQADLDRFHRNAPAALARRGARTMLQEAASGAQTIFFGGLPIVGMFHWGWSAVELLVFLIAGLWIGIVADTLKFAFLRDRAKAFADAMYDDWQVWVVVGALRSGSNKAEASHIGAKWQPGAGIFIDFVMGGISTVFIVGALASQGILRPLVLERRTLWLGLAAMAGMRFLGAAWEIVSHRGGAARDADPKSRSAFDEDQPVKVLVGLRGVGLFLLVFLTAVVAEKKDLDFDAPRLIMLVVSGVVVAYGLLNLVGPLLLWRETRWLRDYLADRARPGRA